jgi:prevent-host-death family protein
MARVPTMIPVSDLREDAADVLRRVQQAKEPVIITQGGRAAAVMLSVQEYERVEHERELLHALARGEKESEEGQGSDLEEVLAAADALLDSNET